MGSNPGHETPVFTIIASLHPGVWVPARVEVDVVFEKAFEAMQQLGLYPPQGAEKDYRNGIGPMTRAQEKEH